MNRSKTKKTKLRKPRVTGRGRQFSMLDKIKQLSIGDAADFAFNAYNAAGKLLAFNSEVKYVDTNVPMAATSYTGVVTPISLLAEGATVSNRIGESVRAHGLEVDIQAYVSAAQQSWLRTVIVVDAECQGTAPTSAQILEVVGSAQAPFSPWNHLGAPRFDIVFDEVITLDPAKALTYHKGKITIPLKHHIRYNGAGGAIGQQYEGGLFVLQLTDLNASPPVMGFQARLHFVDN